MYSDVSRIILLVYSKWTTAPLPLAFTAGGFFPPKFPRDNQPLFCPENGHQNGINLMCEMLKNCGWLGRWGGDCNGSMRGSIGARIRIGQGDFAKYWSLLGSVFVKEEKTPRVFTCGPMTKELEKKKLCTKPRCREGFREVGNH